MPNRVNDGAEPHKFLSNSAEPHNTARTQNNSAERNENNSTDPLKSAKTTVPNRTQSRITVPNAAYNSAEHNQQQCRTAHHGI